MPSASSGRDVPYTHAQPGERCSRCNDPAARVVAAKPLCVDHFTTLIEHCRHEAHRRVLTPQDITPAGFTAWATLLDHGVYIGLITPEEAARAWNTAKDFAQ
jgi:hypothetical protein